MGLGAGGTHGIALATYTAMALEISNIRGQSLKYAAADLRKVLTD
jgi:hypothetical protein